MRSARAVLRGTVALLGAGLALGAISVVRDGGSLQTWQLRALWSWQGAGEIGRLAVGRRAREGGAFLAVSAGEQLALLDARGQALASGALLGRFEVADMDGDGDDELAATEWLEQPPVQLYDERLHALGPNVKLLDMHLPAALRVFDLDGDGRRELLLADFRGCLTVLDYPRFLWDHCLTPGGGETGDPFAVRSLALVRAAGGERLLIASRESGETVALDARGTRRWRHAAGVDGLVDLLALDRDGDGLDEVALATRNHGVIVLDAAGRLARRLPAGDYAAAAVRLEWDGDPATDELLVAHDSGRLSLDALRPGLSDPDGAQIAPAQILLLAPADLDGDGRDEVLAALVTRELTLLARGGGSLRVAASVSTGGSVERLLPFVGDAGRPAFVAAIGSRLQALEATFVRAPAWYSPVNATVLATLVVGLVGLVLLRLRPPLPRDDEAERGSRQARSA